MSLFRALLVVFAALGAACGDAPKLAPLAPHAVVLAFGDSITYGTGASEADSYPAQLERLIGRKVVRAGVPGEVSARALARLPGALEEHQPQLLVLCIGGNDFLRNLGMAQAAANVQTMVSMARQRGIDVLLIGTPEKGILVTPPAFYAEIAEQLRIPYEGSVIGEILRNSELKSDAIHPNARGYRLIAERVAALLRKSGAL
ncbi:MAG: arylesterase [Betaproteobacteria bacterium]|nr:arylesterase [Betaproteobacteria bacterium]MDH4322593.1 arylesterase [Betaproteobacteria bacterium]MDH5576840.1 arylesterase [Betaproteobacteria bacterium]